MEEKQFFIFKVNYCLQHVMQKRGTQIKYDLFIYVVNCDFKQVKTKTEKRFYAEKMPLLFVANDMPYRKICTKYSQIYMGENMTYEMPYGDNYDRTKNKNYFFPMIVSR